MQETTDTNALEAKRPKFLIILLIISFVLVVLNTIFMLTQYFELVNQGHKLSNLGGANAKGLAAAFGALAESFGVDIEKMATSALVQAFINLPILLGIGLMWKQNKIGFYLYALASLIQPIVPLLMGIELLGDMVTMAVWGVIVGAVFTILYAFNLKHLSK